MSIAFDAAASSSGSGTSLTYSHTCASGATLIVGVLAQTGVTVSGVTYNGVSMTSVGANVADGGGYSVTLWYLGSASSGANNIVITCGTSSAAIFGRSVSYTGCDTSSPLGASNSGTTSGTTNHTFSVTTGTDNSWTVLFGRGQNQFLTASTGSTRRSPTAGNADTILFDSNAAITPAGSNSMTYTTPVNDTTAGIIMELKVAGGAAAPTPTLMMLGVGT